MADDKLKELKVAILVTDGFEQVELTAPRSLDFIETGKMRGRRMTSWPSIRTDLKNAGVDWVDQEAVVDGNLVTSRSPDDMQSFNRETIKLFAEASRRRRAA